MLPQKEMFLTAHATHGSVTAEASNAHALPVSGVPLGLHPGKRTIPLFRRNIKPVREMFKNCFRLVGPLSPSPDNPAEPEPTARPLQRLDAIAKTENSITAK